MTFLPRHVVLVLGSSQFLKMTQPPQKNVPVQNSEVLQSDYKIIILLLFTKIESKFISHHIKRWLRFSHQGQKSEISWNYFQFSFYLLLSPFLRRTRVTLASRSSPRAKRRLKLHEHHLYPLLQRRVLAQTPLLWMQGNLMMMMMRGLHQWRHKLLLLLMCLTSFLDCTPVCVFLFCWPLTTNTTLGLKDDLTYVQ